MLARRVLYCWLNKLEVGIFVAIWLIYLQDIKISVDSQDDCAQFSDLLMAAGKRYIVPKDD